MCTDLLNVVLETHLDLNECVTEGGRGTQVLIRG